MNRPPMFQDLTDKQPSGGSGMDMRQFFLCGHKGMPGPGSYRTPPGLGRVAWKCAACAKPK